MRVLVRVTREARFVGGYGRECRSRLTGGGSSSSASGRGGLGTRSRGGGYSPGRGFTPEGHSGEGGTHHYPEDENHHHHHHRHHPVHPTNGETSASGVSEDVVVPVCNEFDGGENDDSEEEREMLIAAGYGPEPGSRFRAAYVDQPPPHPPTNSNNSNNSNSRHPHVNPTDGEADVEYVEEGDGEGEEGDGEEQYAGYGGGKWNDGRELLSAGWGNGHDGAGVEILRAEFVKVCERFFHLEVSFSLSLSFFFLFESRN